MNNMLMRNTKLAVTALVMMLLVAWVGYLRQKNTTIKELILQTLRILQLQLLATPRL